MRTHRYKETDMSEFSVGLDRVRKKLTEDFRVGAQNVSTMVQQPMQNFNTAELSNCLSSGKVRPASSSTASSL